MCSIPSSSSYGPVSPDVLTYWTPDNSIITALIAVQGLLSDPAARAGFNNEGSRLWSNKSEYKRRAGLFVEATKEDYKRVHGDDDSQWQMGNCSCPSLDVDVPR
jgi:hypothetical protein